MKRWREGTMIVLAGIGITAGVLTLANVGVGSTKACPATSLLVIGCVLGTFENLAGGLIAAVGALFAGWLAWSAARDQAAAERDRLAQDRTNSIKWDLINAKMILSQVSRARKTIDDLIADMRKLDNVPSPFAMKLSSLAAREAFPISAELNFPTLGINLHEPVFRARTIAQRIAALNHLEAIARAAAYKSEEAFAKEAIESVCSFADVLSTAEKDQKRRVAELEESQKH